MKAEKMSEFAPSPSPPDDFSDDSGGSPPAADRRSHTRIQVLLEVDYRADETFLFAYITDISAMGIFVRTTQPEPPGTRLELRFTPPGPSDVDAIECVGEVIWINPPRDSQAGDPGMGIRFSELTLPQRERILQLVRTFAYLDDAGPENPQ